MSQNEFPICFQKFKLSSDEQTDRLTDRTKITYHDALRMVNE